MIEAALWLIAAAMVALAVEQGLTVWWQRPRKFDTHLNEGWTTEPLRAINEDPDQPEIDPVDKQLFL